MDGRTFGFLAFANGNSAKGALGSIHTERRAISYTYLSQVWFTLLSMVLFTPSNK